MHLDGEGHTSSGQLRDGSVAVLLGLGFVPVIDVDVQLDLGFGAAGTGDQTALLAKAELHHIGGGKSRVGFSLAVLIPQSGLIIGVTGNGAAPAPPPRQPTVKSRQAWSAGWDCNTEIAPSKKSGSHLK